jgi:hypothetical protein
LRGWRSAWQKQQAWPRKASTGTKLDSRKKALNHSGQHCVVWLHAIAYRDHIKRRGMYAVYIKSLARFLQFLKVQVKVCSEKCFNEFVQDINQNPEKSEFDLLEGALNAPVHAEEPSIIKFMVYLQTFEQNFKDVDEFQV